METLLAAPAMWTSFLRWQVALSDADLAWSQPDECRPIAEIAHSVGAIARSARRAIAAGAVLEACPMGRLRLYRSQMRVLEKLFAAAGSSLAKAEVARALGTDAVFVEGADLMSPDAG